MQKSMYWFKVTVEMSMLSWRKISSWHIFNLLVVDRCKWQIADHKLGRRPAVAYSETATSDSPYSGVSDSLRRGTHQTVPDGQVGTGSRFLHGLLVMALALHHPKWCICCICQHQKHWASLAFFYHKLEQNGRWNITATIPAPNFLHVFEVSNIQTHD